jgi:hypothetical protein
MARIAHWLTPGFLMLRNNDGTYGPSGKDDPVWTRIYLCAENRSVPLGVKTPQYVMHEVALEFDPIHKLAVPLWPPGLE